MPVLAHMTKVMMQIDWHAQLASWNDQLVAMFGGVYRHNAVIILANLMNSSSKGADGVLIKLHNVYAKSAVDVKLSIVALYAGIYSSDAAVLWQWLKSEQLDVVIIALLEGLASRKMAINEDGKLKLVLHTLQSNKESVRLACLRYVQTLEVVPAKLLAH